MSALSPPRPEEYVTSSTWKVWTGASDQCSQGWKLHVAVATASDAQRVLTSVCNRALYPMEVAHKVWPTTDPIGNTGDNGGKWLVVFPNSTLNAFTLVNAIDRAINRLGIDPPDDGAVPDELRVGCGHVYTRYGSYNYKGVLVGKTWVADNRQQICPPGIENPWLQYNPMAEQGFAPPRAWTEPFPRHTGRDVPRKFL
jgi:hypothetical protein